jgi:ATP/maltotriose-dependent transcriptional regulator MalT
VARAMSNSSKASNLHVSEATIKSQLINIYAKRGVASRADSAKKYLRAD